MRITHFSNGNDRDGDEIEIEDSLLIKHNDNQNVKKGKRSLFQIEAQIPLFIRAPMKIK